MLSLNSKLSCDFMHIWLKFNYMDCDLFAYLCYVM